MNKKKAKTIPMIKKLPVTPCGHYVLVKPDKFEKTTPSGIITTTDSEARREEVARVKGTLVAIGSIAWFDYADGSPWAEIGDHVYYKKHISDRYLDESDIVDGKPTEYFLMNDNDIIGIVED